MTPDLPERDWSDQDGRPGIKVEWGAEHATAQVLENGYSVGWTTPCGAAEAIELCRVIGDDKTSAIIRHDGRERSVLRGKDILPFLRAHDCWWVKLTREDHEDYVVYVAGDATHPNELASLGPPLRAAAEEALPRTPSSSASRLGHIRSMMAVTGSPKIQEGFDAVMDRVATTIT